LLTNPISSSSSLSAPPPKQFDYHISIYRAEPPLDETSAYMTLLAAVNELAFMPQRSSIDAGRIWSLLAYNSCVMVKSKEIRFAIWGLLYIFEALHSKTSRFRPMTIDMAWEGRYVGEVHITAECLGSGMLAANRSVELGITAVNTILGNFGGGAGVQYILTPSGGPVAISDVFRVALSVLADSAEMGVDRPFVRIERDELGFRFAAVLDGVGASLMTQADLMRTAVYVVRKMVGDGSFREVRVEVLRDGRKVGEGQLRDPSKAVSRDSTVL